MLDLEYAISKLLERTSPPLTILGSLSFACSGSETEKSLPLDRSNYTKRPPSKSRFDICKKHSTLEKSL